MERKDELKSRVEQAASVIFSTVDAHGMSTCSHAVACRLSPDLDRATLWFSTGVSPQLLADIASNGRIAFVCSNPVDHATVQLKGRTGAMRLAVEAERPFLRERVDRHLESLEAVGVSRRFVADLVHWPAYAVEIAIDAVFEQTPGPNAGTPFQ
jgi:hypothetical protein